MKKIELFQIYNKELENKGMSNIDGISINSTKSDLQQAIDCLQCQDEIITNYLKEIIKEFPNVGKKIKESDYLTHSFDRMYIYATAKAVLGK